MSRIARKDDIQDKRRVSDLEREFQKRELKVYDKTPSVKQVRNQSVFLITENGNKYIGVRIGNEILKAQVV